MAREASVGAVRRGGIAVALAVLAPTFLLASSFALTPGPIEEIPVGRGVATGVNDQGLVAGQRVDTATGDLVAFVYDLTTGTVTPLPPLGASPSFSIAYFVNSSGLVSGISGALSADIRAVLWDLDAGTVTEVPRLGGDESWGGHLTDAGLVVGQSETSPGGPWHGYVYDTTSGTMTDLGTLGGTDSAAWGINDAGLVVGYSDLPGDAQQVAIVYDPATDTMTPLPSLGGSWAEAGWISNDGIVTGGGATAGDATIEAFVYDVATGQMTTLNPFGGDYATAYGINERGIVVGDADTVSDERRGFAYDTRTGETIDLGPGQGWLTPRDINEQLQWSGATWIAGDDFTPRPVTGVLETIPDPPTGVDAAGCAGSVTVSWSSPAFDGNQPVTGYRVFRDGGLLAEVPADAASALDNSAGAGITYEYRVTAVNAQGESLTSQPATITVPACPVASPTSTPVTVAARPVATTPAFTG